MELNSSNLVYGNGKEPYRSQTHPQLTCLTEHSPFCVRKLYDFIEPNENNLVL